MKKTTLAAAILLLAFAPSALAQGEPQAQPPVVVIEQQPQAQPPAVVVQPVPQAPVAETQQVAPAPAPAAECPQQPCLKVVKTKKKVGERWIKVPVYKTYTKKVPCGNDCQPQTVATEGVKVPAPAPKVVVQEQRIIVVTKPVVEYAPVPPVKLGPQRPVIYSQPQVVRVAPPPPPQVIQAAPCPPPVVRAPCNGCAPVAVRSGCPINGYPRAGAYVNGPTYANGPAPVQATPAPSIGRMTGAPGNCPGKSIGEPYQCTSSSTGWCICK